MPWYLGNSMNHVNIQVPSIMGSFILLIIWSSVWKGIALWNSARRGDKGWFVVLLFVNTIGILEICYLTFVARIFSHPETTLRKKK